MADETNPAVGEVWRHRDGVSELDCDVRVVATGSPCPCRECSGHPEGPVYHVVPVDGPHRGRTWGVRRWMLTRDS